MRGSVSRGVGGVRGVCGLVNEKAGDETQGWGWRACRGLCVLWFCYDGYGGCITERLG